MARPKQQEDYLKTALRLPRGLHAKLHEATEATGRSLNAEIVARLQASFDAEGMPTWKIEMIKSFFDELEERQRLVNGEKRG